jgi:hypothetical protein
MSAVLMAQRWVGAREAQTEVSNSAPLGLDLTGTGDLTAGTGDRTAQADKAIVPNSKRSQS